jgi:DNA topoisomerase II
MAAQAEEFEEFEWEEHVAKKGMWAGAVTKVTIPDLRGYNVIEGGRLENIYRDHTPAVLKMFDEAIVNALDHEVRCRNDASKVTYIKVTFDKNGVFSIENNGPSIPVQEHKGVSKKAGRTIYIPEMAFTRLFTGSNMNKSETSVTGGLNGVGGKVITSNSVETIVHAVDTRVGTMKQYVQKFNCPEGKIKINPPTITAATGDSFTRVTFKPMYQRLGYDSVPSDKDYADINSWLHLRLMYSAVYAHSRVKITYNDQLIESTINSLTRLFAKTNIKGNVVESKQPEPKNNSENKTNDDNKTEATEWPHDQKKSDIIVVTSEAKSNKEPFSKYNWKIGIALSPRITKFNHISIINGVVCQKGTHLTVLKKIINAHVETKLQKITKDKDKSLKVSESCNHLNLVVVAAIPGADWGGQRKDELQMKESKINSYELPPSFLDEVANIIIDNMLRSNPNSKRVKIEYEKYTPATSKHGEGKILLAVEGDSANKMIRTGLKLQKSGVPSFEKCGIFSLQGVIMNAMKETTEYDTGDETIYMRSERLKQNKTLEALTSILKLDFNCSYERPEDIRNLTYSKLIGCVDQDLDGSGKILPLLAVYIFMFWPNLLKHGFLGKFMTPLVRVFSKSDDENPIKEFFYENDFKKWLNSDSDIRTKSSIDSDIRTKSSEGKGENSISNYNIIYYKGLARHENPDIRRMFEKFNSNVYIFTLDEGRELFKIYFGVDTAPRKQALTIPLVNLTEDQLRDIDNSKKIPIKVLLDNDTKAYKLDDIKRKIPSIIDGLNRTRRKILAAAIDNFSHNNTPMKVFQFGGYVALNMAYHQGDASLNKTIMTVAQEFTGSRQYPILLGKGYMGSRLGSSGTDGVDLASARYVDVSLNTHFVKSMFPAADKYILQYNFTDGVRVEPQWFAPILPYAIMDIGQIPSEGWKYKGYPIDYDDIVRIVKLLIDGTDSILNSISEALYSTGRCDEKINTNIRMLESRYPLKISVNGFKGKFEPIYDKMHCFGDYEENDVKGIVKIKEIPIDYTISKYLSILRDEKHAEFIDIVEEQCVDDIDIVVKFKKGKRDIIMEKYGDAHKDPIEDFLRLVKSAKPNLNYVGEHGAVIELGTSYLGVILYWFPIRRRMYALRINREIIILKLKIIEIENTIRYIEYYNREGDEIKANKYQDDEVMSKILEEKKYVKLDSALINSPQYTPIEKIEELALRGPRISFSYIFNLKESDKWISSYEKYKKRLIDLKSELDEMIKHLNDKPFAGASIWKSEIDIATSKIKEGVATHWKYKKTSAASAGLAKSKSDVPKKSTRGRRKKAT